MKLRYRLLAACLLIFPSLMMATPPTTSAAPPSATAAAGEWQMLFDGTTLTGWTTKSGQPVTVGWEVRDGMIHRSGAGGDIVTTGEWENFELEFSWKAAAGANSGVKYRVGAYPPAGQGIGPEYQVLDDAGHPNGREPKTSAGSLYDLIPAISTKKLNPVGSWNESRIVARGPHLEHWLNGEKIMEINMASDAWKAAVASSKFKTAPDFGARAGRILLQDHGDEVWFRRIRLRPWPGA
jgi:hypothetical protein